MKEMRQTTASYRLVALPRLEPDTLYGPIVYRYSASALFDALTITCLGINIYSPQAEIYAAAKGPKNVFPDLGPEYACPLPPPQLSFYITINRSQYHFSIVGEAVGN